MRMGRGPPRKVRAGVCRAVWPLAGRASTHFPAPPRGSCCDVCSCILCFRSRAQVKPCGVCLCLTLRCFPPGPAVLSPRDGFTPFHSRVANPIACALHGFLSACRLTGTWAASRFWACKSRRSEHRGAYVFPNTVSSTLMSMCGGHFVSYNSV